MSITNAAATAYSNQKKLVRFSTGRYVAIIGDTGTNAKLMYSDDGLTWGDFGLDVAGWSNGSLATYVDSGGADWIVVVWKQSGTGGGRTDLLTYMMAGKNGVGWYTPVQLYSTTTRNYSDVAAVADGTGGLAMAVTSDPSDGSVRASTLLITSAGVISEAVSHGAISSAYSTTIDTLPSIDIDPVTKSLYCAWSAGATGAGKGIRFEKATYSAGAWTWSTERELDNTIYLLNTDYSVICRWDSTVGVAIIAVLLGYTGTVLVEMVYQRDAADTTTTTLLSDTTTTTYHCGGALVITPRGDIYLFGSLHTAIGSGQQPVSYRKLTRTSDTSVSDGGYVNIEYGDQRWISAIHYDYRIRMIYTGGNNAPYQVRYGELPVGRTSLPLIPHSRRADMRHLITR